MADLVNLIVDVISRLWTCCDKHTRYLCELQKNHILLRNALVELKEARDDVQRKVDEEEADPNETKKRIEQVAGWLERVHTIEDEVEVILQKANEQLLLSTTGCLGGCYPPHNCCSNYKIGKSIAKNIPLVEDLRVKGSFQELTFVERSMDYHLSKLQDNKILLKNNMDELKTLRNDVQRRVVEEEADHSEPKMRTDQLRRWLQCVENIEGEVEVIMQTSYGQLNNAQCLEKDKLIVMKIASVGELMRNGHFEEVTYRLPPPSVQDINLVSTVGMESMFDKVWRLINNNSTDDKPVRIMGLHGHGGVGKTTLLEKINNEFSEHQDHIVIFVVVSKPINIEAIQSQIGERLRLSLKRDERSRANKIFNTLRNKKFVILLDDIWERVDLHIIGIPSPLTQCNSSSSSSKVIFTTRSESVCGLMEATHIFKVECLSWDKAWSLFQDKVGEDALNSFSGARELAKDVANECGGLPLALITIGRAMSTKKSVEEWRDAIKTLRSYASKFEELWIGEGFLDEFDNLDEARDRGHTIIRRLKSVCMLESNGTHYVKMHDVIRDLALWIVNDCSNNRTGNKFLVTFESNVCERWRNAEKVFWKGGPELEENSDDESKGTPISPPTSPNLRTLLLRFNPSNFPTFSLSQNFFQFTPFLRVLDMSRIHLLSKLPTSVCELYELQYLNLSNTCIKELPVELRKLVKLKLLDLDYATELEKIPPGVIANLSQLQVLRLVGSGPHTRGLIGGDGGLSLGELDRLKHLQEVTLTISKSLALEELLCNQKLQRVCTDLVLNNCVLPKSISLLPRSSTTTTSKGGGGFGNLRRLKDLRIFGGGGVELEELILFFINDEGGETTTTTTTTRISKLEVLHLFNLPGLNNIVWEQNHYRAAAQPFQNLYSIDIDSCDALKNLTWIVYVENLKKLSVCNCVGLETMLDDDHCVEEEGASGGCRVFSRLETLFIGWLPNLKSICSHALVFPCIETITICLCQELKKLPLDSRSNINNTLQVIQAKANWWSEVQWEDESIKSKFLPYLNKGGCTYND